MGEGGGASSRGWGLRGGWGSVRLAMGTWTWGRGRCLWRSIMAGACVFERVKAVAVCQCFLYLAMAEPEYIEPSDNLLFSKFV